MAKFRSGRIRQEILREVSEILRRDVKDPRVEGVTITDVEMTGDLQQATIFYSTLSDLAGERQKTQAGLNAAKGKVRSGLGKRLTVYKIPEISFERDRSVDYGSRIDTLLNQLKSSDSTSEKTLEIKDDSAE